MSSFEILRKSIKHFKQGDLGYETFSEVVGEFSSDPTERYTFVVGLRNYTDNIESYDFSDLKKLTEYERDVLAFTLLNLSEEYLTDNGMSPDWNDSIDQ